MDKEGKTKVRLIDDSSEYFHNACVSSTDKVNLSGVDSIANFVKLWARLVHQAKESPEWKFHCTLSTGEVLTRVLHPGFRQEEGH